MRITEVQGYSISHLIYNPFSSSWSEDNKMALITDKSVHILALTPNPKSTLPSLSCARYSIKNDTSLPTSDVGIDVDELIWHVEKADAYNFVLDTTLAPKLSRASMLFPCVKQVAWSPLGILFDQRCILATLTDMGGLSMYKMSNMDWPRVASLSELWAQHCQTLWSIDNIVSLKEQAEELDRRSSQVKITAMCWSRKVFQSATLFITGTKSGEVAIWKVAGDAKKNVQVKLLHTFKTETKMIVALHWLPHSENEGVLLVGSLDGRLQSFLISSQLTVQESHWLWSEQDKMKVSFMDSWEWQNGRLIIVTKEAFMLAFYLDSTGKSVCRGAYRCCDTTVSGLVQLTEDSVLLTTRSGRFTHLTMSMVDKKMCMKPQSVDNYVNLSHMACYGITMSHNKAICGVALSVNQVYDHLILREPSQIILCTMPEVADPLTIVSTSSLNLNYLWDCLEVLRVQIIQKTLIPEIETDRSILDTLEIRKLTLQLWLTTFLTAAEENETKLQELRQLQSEIELLVLSCYVFKRVATLLSQEQILTDFQVQSLGLLKKWLKHMSSLSPEYGSTLATAASLWEQVDALGEAIASQELCCICSDEVPELTDHYFAVCTKGHKVPRCSLSLVPCSEVPYYICCQCGVLAHTLAVKECGYTCIFCEGQLRLDEEILPDDPIT